LLHPRQLEKRVKYWETYFFQPASKLLTPTQMETFTKQKLCNFSMAFFISPHLFHFFCLVYVCLAVYMMKLEKKEEIQKNAEDTILAIQKEIRIQQRTARAKPQGLVFPPFISFLLFSLFLPFLCSFPDVSLLIWCCRCDPGTQKQNQ